MKINHLEAQIDNTLRLGDLDDLYHHNQTFRYDGHDYVIVQNDKSCGLQIVKECSDFICFNLKSHTFRLLNGETRVELTKVSIDLKVMPPNYKYECRRRR